MVHTAYLSLGTNLGDKEHNLVSAITEIGRRIGPVRAQSAFLATEPWGFESENTFLNAAIRVETELSPHALLKVTQQIERDMGRTQKSTVNCQLSTVNCQLSTVTYHDRIIDIDILLYDDLHINTPKLTIPHPLMYERDFVLIPLKEILLTNDTDQ
jgi:2-amino-4-hydroxy-6-hydroxymethyldihydropteridine diphosphokinase